MTAAQRSIAWRISWPGPVYVYVFCRCCPAVPYSSSSRRMPLTGWCVFVQA